MDLNYLTPAKRGLYDADRLAESRGKLVEYLQQQGVSSQDDLLRVVEDYARENNLLEKDPQIRYQEGFELPEQERELADAMRQRGIPVKAWQQYAMKSGALPHFKDDGVYGVETHNVLSALPKAPRQEAAREYIDIQSHHIDPWDTQFGEVPEEVHQWRRKSFTDKIPVRVATHRDGSTRNFWPTEYNEEQERSRLIPYGDEQRQGFDNGKDYRQALEEGKIKPWEV
jgi:hypothetical protein